MSDDLSAVEDWVAGFLAAIDAPGRRRLAKQLAAQLRASQFARIAAQRDPDGATFAPRKPQKQVRGKAGRIKRGAMFTKLRLAKRLRVIQADENEIGVGFTGRNADIARVHQEGLQDRVSRAPGAKSVTYARRRLLGYTEADSERLLTAMLTAVNQQI